MATFEDLTPYSYFQALGGQVRNVGWLGRGSRFATGFGDPGLRAALATVVRFCRVNQMRGFHRCELCPDRVRSYPDGELLLGSAEIHVPGAGDVVYAAPTLIVHYIDEHGYLPPQEFVAAVLRQAATVDRTWVDAKAAILVGTSVSGVVEQSYLSGVDVVLDGFPDVRAVVDADLYRPDGVALEPAAFPEPGEKIVAVVVGHEEDGRRITLRVDPA